MSTPRIVDDPGSLLGDDLRALRGSSPRQVDVQAGLARLTAAIGQATPLAPGLDQSHGDGMGAASGSTAGGGGLAAVLAGKKLAILVITSVAVAGGAVTTLVTSRPVHPRIDPPPAQVTLAPPAIAPLATPSPSAVAPEPPPADTVPQAESPTRPSARPAQSPRPRSHTSASVARKVAPKVAPTLPPAPPAAPTADVLLEEVRLVARARAELERNPRQAVSLVEHARATFPLGALVEEREAIAVFARQRLGEASVAAAEARRFLGRFPHGPFSAKMTTIADGRLLAP
jgi:hypothetical protein